MKRCPQCEFIYEDDQSLCDMDGVLLVFDSRKLPNLHALATVPQPKTGRRNRAVPAFATLTLALVLGMVYYVSTQRGTRVPAVTPASTTVEAPVMNPAPPEQPAAPAAIETTSPEKTVKEERKPVASKSPARNATAKSVTTSESKKPNEEKKDESKVNSILKKTGRILKKPFKF